MATINWNELIEEHEVTYLRADICTGSPESYSLDEKRAICEGIDASNAEVEAALKADFDSMPPEMQVAMLDMLCAEDPMLAEWWKGLLLGNMPDTVEKLMP